MTDHLKKKKKKNSRDLVNQREINMNVLKN